MKLKIFSFSWESFSSDDVVSAILSTAIWEITVLDNHTPLLTSVKPSTISITYLQNWQKKEENFAIWNELLK